MSFDSGGAETFTIDINNVMTLPNLGGDTNKTIALSTPGASNTGIIFNAAGGGNFERTDITNEPNATASSRALKINCGANGVRLFRNGTSWSAVSDRRRKKDIVPTVNNLTILQQISSYKFHYDVEDSKEPLHIGVLADEIQAVLPEVVNSVDEKDEDGNVILTDQLHVNYVELIPILIGAINELAARGP